MHKIISAISLISFLLVNMNASAGVLDNLKSIPATKYDAGKIQLEMVTYVLKEKFKGKDVADSNFEIDAFRILEEGNKLYLVISLIGRAKEMNEEVCKKLNEQFKSQDFFTGLSRNIWPGLAEEDYKKLEEEFIISMEMTSKENESFKIKCE